MAYDEEGGYYLPGMAVPGGDIVDYNQAGAESDPFAYTQGSLLTPWTREFNYEGGVPTGGYYSGSGGYSPMAPFNYEDFSYGFSQPGSFGREGQFTAPAPFNPYDMGAEGRVTRPADFVSPTGPYVADRFVRPETIDDDPGYQFRLREGERALQNAAAAKGILRTGGTWKGLMGYGQELASQEYQNAFQRALDAYDRNFTAGLTENVLNYDRAASEYDRRTANDLAYNNTNYARAASEYDRSWQNAFNTNQANFENAYKAWRGNADISLGGQGLGFNIASGVWDRNYNKAASAYQMAVQQAETAAQIAAQEAAASAASAQWADQTNYNRALNKYEMDYNAFQNNQANQFSRLYSLASLGQNSANTLTGAGSNYYTGAGNAGAAGAVGGANAWNLALGNIGNLAGNIALVAALPKSVRQPGA